MIGVGDDWGRGKIYKWRTVRCELGWVCAVVFAYPVVLGTRKEFKLNQS